MSADDPVAAAEAVADADSPPDICVVAPSWKAHATATTALRGRWIEMVEEPLFAQRGEGESGDDVLARLAQGLRGALALQAELR